jgi:Zn-dependent peptidase ImmA (M78 family)/transcriptional regulator with XRE-family HTH domain
MAKGWSMVDLAKQVNLTRQAISSFEKGDTSPCYETLRELSKALEVKEAFFCLPLMEDVLKKESAINFRTLKSAHARELEQTRVYLELFAELCGVLQNNYVNLQPVKLPKFDIADFAKLELEDIQYFAEQTRRFFGLGDAPISNLTLLLENHGVLVGYLPLPPKIDGISVWYNKRAFALINSKAYACRARLDLAHELGHLILHTSLSQEDLEQKEVLKLVEKQAFQFGMAFLVPEKTIAKEFYSTDLKAFEHSKKRWGVSMQALAVWLNEIDLISDSQKIYFFQKMAQYRRKEPLDSQLIPERSISIKRIAELLDEKNILSGCDFLAEIVFPEYLVKPISNLPDDFFERKFKENNVFQLKAIKTA